MRNYTLKSLLLLLLLFSNKIIVMRILCEQRLQVCTSQDFTNEDKRQKCHLKYFANDNKMQLLMLQSELTVLNYYCLTSIVTTNSHFDNFLNG